MLRLSGQQRVAAQCPRGARAALVGMRVPLRAVNQLVVSQLRKGSGKGRSETLILIAVFLTVHMVVCTARLNQTLPHAGPFQHLTHARPT